MSSSRLIFSRIAAAYLLLAVTFTPAFAQGLSAQELGAPLPLDAAIRTGALPNGLTFFVRRNVEPANRAALRLAVKAGSIDEADDQRGLAHLLEHMAFNGSEHFEAGDLVKYLESIGSRFGPDVNAYTSFDETVYMLEVPTDRPAIIERGFEALSDFAGGIQLDAAEIDKERGVVIEEWRLRQGAQSRMQDAQLQGLFGDSRYVQRLPIGLPEILKSFPAQRIRDFYRDHYRADRMAVIVVGDVDVAATEALIRTHFSGLATRPPAARTVYPVPPHRETRYVTTSDREAQASSVSIVHKRPLQLFRTVGDYRRSLLGSLVDQMLNSRLAEIARRPDARFLGASVGGQTLGQTVEGFTVSARTKDGGIAEGLEAIAQEIARVTQHGFGDAELDRAKKGMIAGLERAYNERDKSQSGGFASELIRHFLTGEPAPGIAMELDLARKLLPAMTAADASALARDVLGDDSRVVLAVSPEKEGIAPVTQTVLSDALRVGLAASVEPWRDALEGRALMADLPAAGPVRARREIAEIGVTVLTLSNGVEVWLKPTDFRNDQVSFTSYARGGVSLAPEADYLNASLSTSIVGLSGVGGINPVDLGKLLAGKIANASTYVSSYTHGISGGSTPRDLETALQLVYLQFTSPNRDPQALDLMKRRLEANLANQAQNPGAVFGERVRRLNTLDHYSSRSLKVEDLPALDADRMHEFYQARFRNAADFTFFFVGAFTVDEITPLVAQYLGSLPSAGTPTSAVGANLRLQFPAGVQRETVRKGQEPRSQTSITFFADTGLEEFEVHRVRAATSILQNRLRDVLREELGGTYSVGVGYSDTTPQPGYGTTSVSFGSAPENVEKLSGAVMTELDRLRRDGPTDAEVQVVIETERRDLETSLKTNNYWLNSLQTAHLLGRDPRAILQRIARAETLTRANVHEMFRKYFPENRHTVVTLMPEVAPPRAAGQ